SGRKPAELRQAVRAQLARFHRLRAQAPRAPDAAGSGAADLGQVPGSAQAPRGITVGIDARALTRELLAFNTINPPGMDRARAHRLGAILEEAGFAVEYHEYAEARTSLIATIGGGGDKAPICFTGHMDTVPLGAAPWHHDAFAGETD